MIRVCESCGNELPPNRKLLCHGCNAAIGLFKENTTAIRLAAEYLEKYNGN